MWGALLTKYLDFECKAIGLLRRFPFMHEYTNDPTSARITLFLTTVGLMALVNEFYITIEMSLLQKKTYDDLNNAPLDVESLRNHPLVIDDEFHGKEWLDEKSGIVIEEFETLNRFFAKPVHVSHLYVECSVIEEDSSENSEKVLSEPFIFHLEFSPEEWELEKRPEFGCILETLRRKLYHFFKDSHLHEEYVVRGREVGVYEPFTLSNSVRIYNIMQELLPTTVDDVQLCFLKMETGDTIKCKFVV
ncbi:LAFA_0F11232g1_1 [Lachancea sp. 'fantastica']|nr:LAFA_0F11232g1_1 [Lachancea sp. 'fantastica']